MAHMPEQTRTRPPQVRSRSPQVQIAERTRTRSPQVQIAERTRTRSPQTAHCSLGSETQTGLVVEDSRRENVIGGYSSEMQWTASQKIEYRSEPEVPMSAEQKARNDAIYEAQQKHYASLGTPELNNLEILNGKVIVDESMKKLCNPSYMERTRQECLLSQTISAKFVKLASNDIKLYCSYKRLLKKMKYNKLDANELHRLRVLQKSKSFAKLKERVNKRLTKFGKKHKPKALRSTVWDLLKPFKRLVVDGRKMDADQAAIACQDDPETQMLLMDIQTGGATEPVSYNSYVIVDSRMLEQAETAEDMFASVHYAGMTKNLNQRWAAHKSAKFPESRYKMVVVRTWTQNDILPRNCFNNGMASFVDEYLIHENASLFSENFKSRAGGGMEATFLNEFAKSLMNDDDISEMQTLLYTALSNRNYVPDPARRQNVQQEEQTPQNVQEQQKKAMLDNIIRCLPKRNSASSYVMVNSELLEEAETIEEMFNSIVYAGMTYAMSPELRQVDHKSHKFPKDKYKMLVVRTWKKDEPLPDNFFNVGMASFVDEYLIHEYASSFNKKLKSRPGASNSVSFANNYAKSLMNEENVSEMKTLLFEALTNQDYVQERFPCAYCDTLMTHTTYINRHLSTSCKAFNYDEKNPEYQCDMCYTTCTTQYNLDRHLNEENQECPFLKDIDPKHKYWCPNCTRGYTRPDGLERHLESRCSVLGAKRHSARRSWHN